MINMLMKRLLITIALLLSVVFSVNAQSVRWGLKGGVSFIDMNKSHTSGTGWFVGPMLDVSLPFSGFFFISQAFCGVHFSPCNFHFSLCNFYFSL